MPKRRHPISRLEAFSDAVFAFAATLLVVSLEVPRSFPELVDDMRGFVAFGIAFGALVLIWSVHNGFFRRCGGEDLWTVLLNACLLFVVLFYVYPLKFMSQGIAVYLLRIEHPDGAYRIEGFDQLGTLFSIYGAAFVALFLCVALLYLRASRRRGEAALDDTTRHEARFYFRHYLVFALVGALSVTLALAGVGLRWALPGWIYFLIGPLTFWHSRSFSPPADDDVA